MKISKETLSIIKSFSDLNINLFFKAGNVIATKNAEKGLALNTVMARAEIAEFFPINFGIYNLKEFLGVIDTFNDPEFEFNDCFVEISEGNHSVKYGFAEEDSLIYPSRDKYDYDNLFVEFLLDADTLKKIKKIGNVISAKELIINAGVTGVTINITDRDNPSANEFKIEFPEKEASEPFSFAFDLSYFSSIINGDYNCKVVSLKNSIKFLILTNSKGLEYYIIYK